MALRVLRRGTEKRISLSAGADGICEARFGPWEIGAFVLVERLSIHHDSASQTEASIYIGQTPDPTDLVEHTYDGNDDIGDQSSPILVPGNEILLVRWTGADVGAKGSARIQYRVEENA